MHVRALMQRSACVMMVTVFLLSSASTLITVPVSSMDVNENIYDTASSQIGEPHSQGFEIQSCYVKGGLEVTFNLISLDIEEIFTDGGAYNRISINDAAYTDEVGRPMMPVVSRLFAMPDAEIDIEIIDTEYRHIALGKVVPAQEPDYDQALAALR